MLAGSLRPATAPDYEAKRQVRQPQHRLTPDEITAVSEEYRAGLSMREIAEIRKINRETVALALQPAGILTRNPKALTTTQLSEAASLYAEGWSLNRLGRKYGIDPKTMKKRLAMSGAS